MCTCPVVGGHILRYCFVCKVRSKCRTTNVFIIQFPFMKTVQWSDWMNVTFNAHLSYFSDNEIATLKRGRNIKHKRPASAPKFRLKSSQVCARIIRCWFMVSDSYQVLYFKIRATLVSFLLITQARWTQYVHVTPHAFWPSRKDASFTLQSLWP
jgi:hypothetical protein